MRTVAIGLLLWTGLALAAAGDEAKYHLKPGAGGKACLGCHTDFAQTLAQPSVHTPVRAGRCADCHDPHAAAHGKLLSAAPNAVCTACHPGVVPADARSVHAVAASGECTSCHDPHASANRGNLLQAGNELCLACHGELGEAISAAAFKHSPVQKSCLTCHQPHASARNEHLLVKDEGALCGGCHRTDAAPFVKAHGGYPVAKARCTSCHDPHGSNSRGSLWATVHPPVASGMCEQCHNPPGSPQPLATKTAGAEGCRACHAELVGRTFVAKHTHWPALDGTGCLNCHSPHATREHALLRAAPAPLCFSCHAATERRQQATLTKHPPAEAGECVKCHDPHASDAPFLFRQATIAETCATCHDWQKHSNHPLGDKVKDPRNPNLPVDCTSCHRSHGAAFAHLAPFDTEAALCVQCHAKFRR
ncbi:MAG TPA: cytochrome c3 family protein [Candidatus Polarisedimenticolaceae bacterium]|nr:cytochrome c3 family protein [Candidatus Polarisedimenticolaceae bacterium]